MVTSTLAKEMTSKINFKLDLKHLGENVMISSWQALNTSKVNFMIVMIGDLHHAAKHLCLATCPSHWQFQIEEDGYCSKEGFNPHNSDSYHYPVGSLRGLSHGLNCWVHI
jgi:hypothetical protein